MGLQNFTTQALLLGTVTAGILTIGIYLYQKKRKHSMPTKWQPVGRVKELFLYPLKSGHRIELNTANCAKYGIELQTESGGTLRDRCLVVYKAENKEFKTARLYPKMVLIKVSVNKQNRFVITAPNMSTLEMNIPDLNKSNEWNELLYWGDEKYFTIDCGDEAAQWCSQYILGKSNGLRLGYHNGIPPRERNIDPVFGHFTKIYPYFINKAMGLYTDTTSYMVMNQSSVDDLVSRIPESRITSNHFRPTILIDGPDPYSEDKWEWLKIGDVVLYTVKPCTRCTLPNIDPETGMRSSKNEPLKTLKTYRKVRDLRNIELEGDDPIMGVQMALRIGGPISVGDTVFVGQK